MYDKRLDCMTESAQCFISGVLGFIVVINQLGQRPLRLLARHES